MPLQLPVLDDRSFEQLLAEAKRRIPVHTPEWTNFDVASDPGITLVELFAYVADTLIYRANRIPERNRLKFLQLLGIPLQAAAAARGIVAIRNDRGPLEALPLDPGVVVTAGSVSYLTRDGVTVLPVEAQVYYKLNIPPSDPRYQSLLDQHEAVKVAQAAAAEQGAPGAISGPTDLVAYETTPMPMPTSGNPNPVVDLVGDTTDRAVYVALLAPQGVDPEDARQAIANKILSIGLVPALDGVVPPLQPRKATSRRGLAPSLVYEIPDVQPNAAGASYTWLSPIQAPDVLNEAGVVQLPLPGASRLQVWEFGDPEQEGMDDFPPRIEDPQVAARLVTWIRIRLPNAKSSTAPAAGGQPGGAPPASAQGARLTWVGINATRVVQAVPVVGELVGLGTGEPDQVATLANRPVLVESVRVTVEEVDGTFASWRLTDDLLAAGPDDQVFDLDPEAGQIRFGDGLRGARPAAGRRIVASYEYGGGPQGNVAIGAIKASPDALLQGGFKLANPVATWGGDTGESVAEAERNIPLYLKHHDRLVTEQDFKDVTWRASGVDVGRVEVLTQFIPDKPSEPAPGAVTVVVVPRADAIQPLWPSPDRLFLRTVCDYLEPRRLVTTEVHVRGPLYRDVYVTVGVEVQAGHFPDVVRKSASDRLSVYLSSLPPGGPDGLGWPLNKQLLKKDLEAVVTRVPGVEFVNSLNLGVESSVDRDDFAFSGLEMPRLAGLAIVEGDPDPLTTVVPGEAGPAPAGNVLPVPVKRVKC